jgi:choline dehydrogenase-like flavoprotein
VANASISNLCSRGCPYGDTSAVMHAHYHRLHAKTGNMTLRPNSIAYELIYDEAKGKATGVKVLDAETGEQPWSIMAK